MKFDWLDVACAYWLAHAQWDGLKSIPTKLSRAYGTIAYAKWFAQ